MYGYGYACTMKKAHYKFTKTGIIHTEGVSNALALPLWKAREVYNIGYKGK